MAKKQAPKKQENVKEVVLPLTEKTKLHVRFSEYEGVNRIDIRKHITSAKFTGYDKFGLNYPVEIMKQIHTALGQILETVEKEGLWNEVEEEAQ